MRRMQDRHCGALDVNSDAIGLLLLELPVALDLEVQDSKGFSNLTKIPAKATTVCR
jgi:hypothetical protein